MGDVLPLRPWGAPAVLLVGIDAVVRTTTAAYLRGLQFTVTEVTSFQEAAVLLRRGWIPHVLFLDVPAVAVIEASKFALEVQQDHPNLALLVSHDGNPHVAVAQTIALLRKPYSLAAVAARISALVRELPDRPWIGQEQRQ
jgi:DNA-binding response OmpR family regulator